MPFEVKSNTGNYEASQKEKNLVETYNRCLPPTYCFIHEDFVKTP